MEIRVTYFYGYGYLGKILFQMWLKVRNGKEIKFLPILSIGFEYFKSIIEDVPEKTKVLKFLFNAIHYTVIPVLLLLILTKILL